MTMETKEDYYAILRMKPNATHHDIKIAFRQLALRLHPDKNKCDTTEAFQRLDRAWYTLRDQTRRDIYDRDIYYPSFVAGKPSRERSCSNVAGNSRKSTKTSTDSAEEERLEKIRMDALAHAKRRDVEAMAKPRKPRANKAAKTSKVNITETIHTEKERSTKYTGSEAREVMEDMQSEQGSYSAHETAEETIVNDRAPDQSKLKIKRAGQRMRKQMKSPEFQQWLKYEEQHNNREARSKVELMRIWRQEKSQQKATAISSKMKESEAARLCQISRETEVFRFLDLPGELKNMIYEYTMRIRTYNAGNKPALLRALRFTHHHADAERVYYGINVFQHSIMSNGSLDQVSSRIMRLTKTLTLRIPRMDTYIDTTTAISPKILDATNLEHLTLYPQGVFSALLLHTIVHRYIPNFKKLKTLHLSTVRGYDHKSLWSTVQHLQEILGVGVVKEQGTRESGRTQWTFLAKGNAFEMKERHIHIKFD